MRAHSPTPWRFIPEHRGGPLVLDAKGNPIVAVEPTTDDPQATVDAERAVVCVNACEALPDPAKLPVYVAQLRSYRSKTPEARELRRSLLATLGVSDD